VSGIHNKKKTGQNSPSQVLMTWTPGPEPLPLQERQQMNSEPPLHKYDALASKGSMHADRDSQVQKQDARDALGCQPCH